MLPVVALAAAARVIGSTLVLLIVLALHSWLVTSAAPTALAGASSTDPIALLIVTLLSLFGVVPAAVLVSLCLGRINAVWR